MCIPGGGVPGRGQSKCKVPEVGEGLVCLRTIERNVAGSGESTVGDEVQRCVQVYCVCRWITQDLVGHNKGFPPNPLVSPAQRKGLT